MKKINYHRLFIFLTILFLGILISIKSKAQSGLLLTCPPSVNCIPNITAAGGITGSGISRVVPVFLTPTSVGNSIIASFSSPTPCVVIGSGLGDASSILKLSTTNAGFLEPRMSTGAKTSIPVPAEGLQLYDNTIHLPQWYNGTTWKNFDSPNTTVIAGEGITITGSQPTFTIAQSNPIMMGSITITSAQLATSASTTLTVIPAVAGKIIDVIEMSAVTNYGGATYLLGGQISFKYQGGTQVMFNIPATFLTVSTSTNIAKLVTGAWGSGIVNATNTNFILSFSAANFTTGNGNLVIYYSYYLITP